MNIKKSLQAALVATVMAIGMPVASAGTEPFIGEVQWFAGTFAPGGWAFCNGQLLAIAENTALFSILGTTYGGDGRTTFALPDLQGRGMVHSGTGPGLTPRTLGRKAGTETETLSPVSIPAHTHTLRANDTGGDSVLPDDRVLSSVGRLTVFDEPPADVDMHSSSVARTDGGQSHNNMQPSFALNCIIALAGAFPPRGLHPAVKPGGVGDPAPPVTLPQVGRN